MGNHAKESINPTKHKVELPNSKTINIEGTNFKYEVHYDQLDDKDLLMIEKYANHIFHAYQERYDLDISTDFTFKGFTYNNLTDMRNTSKIAYATAAFHHYPYNSGSIAHDLTMMIYFTLNYYNKKYHGYPGSTFIQDVEKELEAIRLDDNQEESNTEEKPETTINQEESNKVEPSGSEGEEKSGQEELSPKEHQPINQEESNKVESSGSEEEKSSQEEISPEEHQTINQEESNKVESSSSEEEKSKVEEKKSGQEEISPEEHQTINQEESNKVESSSSEEEKSKVEEKKSGQEEISPKEHQTIYQEESKKVESSSSEEEKSKVEEEKSGQEEISPKEHQTIYQEESKKVEPSGSGEEKGKVEEEKSGQEELSPEKHQPMLPHSKVINIEGTKFKLKIHYDQLDDKDFLMIEKCANYIFCKYGEKNGLDIEADDTFDTNVYNNYLSYGDNYLQEVLEDQIFYSLAKSDYNVY